MPQNFTHPRYNQHTAMRHLDLFSGIGGFSLAFERHGFRTIAFSEIDPFACRVLAHHWPAVPNLGDVTRIDGAAVRERFGHIDLVTFGTPCQDLSVAGKRAGLNGERSGLFHEAIRVIRELRPTFALWENVPGAFSTNGGWDFAAVLDSLAECGALDLAWRVLDAQFCGVPQRRDRIFVVADFGGERAGEILSVGAGVRGDSAPRREAGEDAPYSITERTRSGGRNLEWQHDLAYCVDNPGAGQMPMVVDEVFSDVGGSTWRQGEPTLAASDDNGTNHVVTHVTVNPTAGTLKVAGGKPGQGYPAVQGGFGVRRLTPVECERLMNFPDGWTDVPDEKGKPAADGPRYRVLGNAVVPCVVEQIAERLRAAMVVCVSVVSKQGERLCPRTGLTRAITNTLRSGSASAMSWTARTP